MLFGILVGELVVVVVEVVYDVVMVVFGLFDDCVLYCDLLVGGGIGVVYWCLGDCNVLVEYGLFVFDLNLCFCVYVLMGWFDVYWLFGMFDLMLGIWLF